jgi:hypothetical protein
MSSRYAAAHARREQRRREITGREYLPLAEEAAVSTQTTSGFAGRLRSQSGGNAVLTSRLPAIDYSYLRGDLIRTGVLAASLFLIMILLSFVL